MAYLHIKRLNSLNLAREAKSQKFLSQLLIGTQQSAGLKNVETSAINDSQRADGV